LRADRELAAEALETAAGRHRVSRWGLQDCRTDRAHRAGRARGAPAGEGVGLGYRDALTPSWPNGAQVCEVEVDPETGEVRLASIVSCDDIGRIINHMIVEGQIQAALRRRRPALYEQAIYDQDSGSCLSGSFMDYCVPRARPAAPPAQCFR